MLSIVFVVVLLAVLVVGLLRMAYISNMKELMRTEHVRRIMDEDK